MLLLLVVYQFIQVEITKSTKLYELTVVATFKLDGLILIREILDLEQDLQE